MNKEATLKGQFEKMIADSLMEIHHYKSVMQIPKLEKIVINAGVGDATKDAKLVDSMANEIELITGQKPIKTRSKKAIATFKLRENQEIGVKVTLRGDKMWNFVSNLINVAIPRVRDFKGVPTASFDGHGNYTLGIKEQIIFTEINYDSVKKIRGFDVTFVTSSKNDEEARELLKAIGMPFAKQRTK
ncbi:MAG: 50S ribosomal protein L5 [Mycoplasmataceae bacterium]|nr:50S ribosomal protein L5 [Mycoplasmataceae bacterium]